MDLGTTNTRLKKLTASVCGRKEKRNAWIFMSVCVRACVCVCVRVRACVFVRVRERERIREREKLAYLGENKFNLIFLLIERNKTGYEPGNRKLTVNNTE